MCDFLSICFSVSFFFLLTLSLFNNNKVELQVLSAFVNWPTLHELIEVKASF